MNKMGIDIVTHWGRCFVQINKINSLFQFHELSLKYNKKDSVAAKRNTMTFFLFFAGTMFELRNALKPLEKFNIRDRISNTKLWDDTLADVDQICTNETLMAIRNRVAFHPPDPKVIRASLVQLSRHNKECNILEFNTECNGETYLLLGEEQVWSGLKKDKNYQQPVTEDDFAELCEKIISVEQWLKLSDNIQEIFIDACEKAGVQFTEIHQ